MLGHEILPFGGLNEAVSSRAHDEDAARVSARRTPGMRTRATHRFPPRYEAESERAVSIAMSIWVSAPSSPLDMDTSGTTPMPSISCPKGLR